MKIYIMAESTSTSGGPESLHQLTYILRKKGYDSYIYYVDRAVDEVAEKFSQYEIKIAQTIEDNSHNILIVPESYTEELAKYKNINKAIWWLSLDFYKNNLWINRTMLFCKDHRLPNILFPIIFTFLMITNKLKFNLYRFKDVDNIYHLYNCEYVNNYLIEHGVTEEKKSYLCGPLRSEYFDILNNKKRENIVLYNPKKGMEFTKKIIEYNKNKNIRFIALQNMTPQQIRNLMIKSKVYIDFGYFPGPERIPREAAMMGLNIITSNLGSAQNQDDVPIPQDFKFSLDNGNLSNISKLIDMMINEYEKYNSYFSKYRNKVIEQKNRFESDITFAIQSMERK